MSSHGKVGVSLLFMSVVSIFWFVFNIMDYRREQTYYQSLVKLTTLSNSIIHPDAKYFEANYSQVRLKENIDEVCQAQSNLHMKNHRLKNEFMVDENHKLAYCRHGKVGTTTWMEHFVKLLPEDIQNDFNFANMNSAQLHQAVPKHFSLKRKDIVDPIQINGFFYSKRIFVFSFVRHPFDRLVSAYLDKIDSGGSENYKGVKKHLKKFYGDASFNNFILYVIDKIEKYEDCTAKNLQCNAIDVHWRPFYLRCDYCDVNYNYIGRMETFEQDVRFIISYCNLTEIIPLQEAALQSHSTARGMDSSAIEKDDKTDKIKATKRALRYFQEVELSNVRRLYNIFKPDFDLFQYSADEFF